MGNSGLGRKRCIPRVGAGRGSNGRAREGRGASQGEEKAPLLLAQVPTMSRWPVSNWSAPWEFVILGFSGWPPELRALLFALLLPLYLATLTGNLLIVGLAVVDAALHTPMYFFLVNLAVVDILCSPQSYLSFWWARWPARPSPMGLHGPALLLHVVHGGRAAALLGHGL